MELLALHYSLELLVLEWNVQALVLVQFWELEQALVLE
jgi:hypothetical protein